MSGVRRTNKISIFRPRLMATAIVSGAWLLSAAPSGAATMVHAINAYLQSDYRNAIMGFDRHAQQGVALAQHLTGVMYRDGKGVPQDDKKAAHWFELASKKGLAASLYALGEMYDKGWGVARNATRAKDLFRRAAAAGYSSAKAIPSNSGATSTPGPKEIRIFVDNPTKSISPGPVSKGPVAKPKPRKSRSIDQIARESAKKSGARYLALPTPNPKSTSRRSPSYQSPTPRTNAPPSAKPGGIYVQVAALKSEENTLAFANKLEKTFPKLFDGRHIVVEGVAGLSGRILYRLQILGFSTANQAWNFCREILKVNEECMIDDRGKKYIYR